MGTCCKTLEKNWLWMKNEETESLVMLTFEKTLCVPLTHSRTNAKAFSQQMQWTSWLKKLHFSSLLQHCFVVELRKCFFRPTQLQLTFHHDVVAMTAMSFLGEPFLSQTFSKVSARTKSNFWLANLQVKTKYIIQCLNELNRKCDAGVDLFNIAFPRTKSMAYLALS